MTGPARDHGGGLDAAIARFGGARRDWLDLSTGINPVPYPLGDVTPGAWSALPDTAALDRLLTAARGFWQVPGGAEIIAAPGASALIARIPNLGPGSGSVHVPAPTYNEHAAAFAANGNWTQGGPEADTHVYVHPNNPDGRLWPDAGTGSRRLTVIDESFCDVTPDQSHIEAAEQSGVIILKSFGKFWGLAGLRLGFAIGHRDTLAGMADLLGPWSVAGPALEIGARALEDTGWADTTRSRLARDSARLDSCVTGAGARLLGGTDLFRLYAVADATSAQDVLATHHIWTRIFPYSRHWLRIGLPAPDRWDQLETALGMAGGAMAQPSDEPAS